MAAFSTCYRSRAFALAAGSLLVMACGGGGGSSSGSNPNSADRDRFTVNPGIVDFGKTVIGQTVSGTLVVTNAGTRDLNLIVSTPGEGFTITETCGVVAPQQRCTLRLEFSPTEQKAYSSTLNLTSGDLQLSPILQGTGQGLSVQITSVTNVCEDATFIASISVTDATANPILGLRSEQVTAFLNDAEANPIADLEIITERKTVAAGLTLDWSSSLTDRRQDIIDASRVFIDSLGLEEDGLIDRAGVFKFSLEMDRNAQNFIDADEPGRTTLLEALTRPFSGSATGSNIWGATDLVVAEAADQPNPIRAAVLLSDGRNSGELSLDTLIENAQEKSTRVFTVGFGNLNPGPLRRLAEETGGLFFSDPDATGLMEIYARIASVLTNQYEVTYDNPSPGSTNELRIVVKDDADLEGEDTFTIASCS